MKKLSIELKRFRSKKKIEEAYINDYHFSAINDSFKTYINNDDKFTIKCCASKNLNSKDFEWLIDLLTRNMKDLYLASSSGWNKSLKEKEMKHKDAIFLLAFDQFNNPAGFVHFRFEWDDDKINCSLYCYELQIEPKYQRKGLGAHLMSILYQLAKLNKMPKITLTCFTHNAKAQNFYKQLQFVNDRTCPTKFNLLTSYEILSKKVCMNEKL